MKILITENQLNTIVNKYFKRQFHDLEEKQFKERPSSTFWCKSETNRIVLQLKKTGDIKRLYVSPDIPDEAAKIFHWVRNPYEAGDLLKNWITSNWTWDLDKIPIFIGYTLPI